MFTLPIAVKAAMALLPGASDTGASSGWVLYWEQELTTGPLQRINKRLVQNPSGSPLAVSEENVVYYSVDRSVTGEVNDDPPWPTWLRPLSENQQQTTLLTPSIGDPVYVLAGYEYRCDHRLRVETGGQAYYRDPEDVPLYRPRYWSINSYLDEYVQLIP